MVDLNEEFWINVSEFLNANPALVFKFTTTDSNSIKQRGLKWFESWQALKSNIKYTHDICRILKDLRYLKESNAYISSQAFEYLNKINLGLKEIEPNIENVEVVGGDRENSWYFYPENNSYLEIATWAKQKVGGIFENMPLDEIMNKHMFFGSDTGFSKGFYNGDTIVLYKDIDALEENVKQDAEFVRK